MFDTIIGLLVCAGLLMSVVAFAYVGYDASQRRLHLTSAFSWICCGWSFLITAIAVNLMFG